MKTGKALLSMLLPFLAKITAVFATEDSLQKQFDAAVHKQDYDQVLQLGYPLTAQLIAGSKPEKASVAYREMASTCFFRGEYLKAIRYCSSGFALLREEKSPNLAFKHTSTMAECYARISLLDSAGYWFMRSEALLDRYPDVLRDDAPYVKALYNNLGIFHLQQRDTHQALLYYEKALDMAKQGTDRRAIGIAYNSLAHYYNQVAKYDEAETYYRHAAAHFDSKSVDKCWILLSLANNELKRNRYTQSLSYAGKSIGLYVKVIQSQAADRHLLLEKRQLIRLAECYYRLGRLNEAEASYRKCLQVIEKEGGTHSEELAYCYLGLGRIYESEKNWETALTTYQKALIASSFSFRDMSFQHNPAVDDVLSSRALMDILGQKAACLLKVKEISAKSDEYNSMAFDAFLRAIDEAEKLRKNMNAEASKLFFAETLRPAFDNAVALGYELGNSERGNSREWIEKTVVLLERSRRVVLSDVFHERHIKPGAIPPEILEEEALLQQEIAKTRTHYMNTADTTRRDSIRTSMKNSQIQLRKLLRQMEIYNPAYVAERHGNPAPDISEIRAKMGAKTAYLAYYMAASHYYLYVITRDDVWISRFKTPADFYIKLERLHRSLVTDPLLYSFDGTDAAEWFYRHLIKPAYPKLQGYSRWLVSRDGQLNLIPFEILQNRDNGRLLIASHAVSYLHSSESLTLPLEAGASLTNMIGFAPYHKPYPIDSARWLPYTEKEIRETSNLLFLGPEASKEQFFRVVGQANALHLATHAQYNDSIPEHSYISFFPGGADHKLFAHEIATLPLEKVRLAILSFCEADRGRIHQGEGMLSFARSFRLAGCPGMLATLWKADDEITSYIIALFYQRLKEGESPDIALQKAKSTYFSSELGSAHNHPYYWANIVYIGDTAPIFAPFLPHFIKKPLYMIPGLFLLLSALYYVRSKRKRFS